MPAQTQTDALTPGFAAATRQHLQHDIAAYTALFVDTAAAGSAVDWLQAHLLRDHLLKTIKLAAITAKAVERGGDSVTIEALADAWLRSHRG